MEKLGVYIDQHLNWKDQITQVKNKLSKNIGVLYIETLCEYTRL